MDFFKLFEENSEIFFQIKKIDNEVKLKILDTIIYINSDDNFNFKIHDNLETFKLLSFDYELIDQLKLFIDSILQFYNIKRDNVDKLFLDTNMIDLNVDIFKFVYVLMTIKTIIESKKILNNINIEDENIFLKKQVEIVEKEKNDINNKYYSLKISFEDLEEKYERLKVSCLNNLKIKSEIGK